MPLIRGWGYHLQLYFLHEILKFHSLFVAPVLITAALDLCAASALSFGG